MKFVHLKTVTEYSLNKGINRISGMVEKAAEDNMGALAITDHNGMFGSIEFYKEARKAGIKPIVGIDITVEQDDGFKYQLTLIAKNEVGYKSLIALNSKAFTENRTLDSVAIKEDWLSELSQVVVLSGAKHGLIGKKIMAGETGEAIEIAKQMKDAFGDDFYIELQRDATPDEEKYMDGAIEVCAATGIAPVATHPCYFSNSDDFLAHEARYCIGHKKELFDIKRERPFNKEMYFKTQDEMSELFADLPQALENSVIIAQKCNIDLTLGKPVLPEFPTPNGEDVDTYFAQLARKGLEERLVEDFPDAVVREQKRAEYEKRLETEIEIIQGMKFPGYFLIVSDFITWAKNNDIPVGPGRGSGAGSLVAYSLKITDIDPLPYKLLFERFLNPARVSMPDFDVDFCQARREEVIKYVRDKYGEDSVGQIGTFGTMAAKAVVNDVGRTLAYPHDLVSTISKMIYIPPGKDIKLGEFIFGSEEKGILPDEKFLTMYNNEPDVKKLIDIALKIEGTTRQVGIHAAGVVISPTVLTDYTPLYSSDKDVPPSTQFNMGDVEAAGLVKFDFLGLKNLTIIKEAVDLANKRKAEKGEDPLVLRKVSLNDPTVFENIFNKGNTKGIFQCESTGMTGVLKKAQPESIEDIIAIISLYRPGPMEIIPEWLAAKALPEEKRDYPHPTLREALKETYGFMIYQEQVMQCAQIIAGYSLGEADLLRRAMGKKKPEEMKKQREIFIAGAAKNNVSEETAIHLFNLIEKFSGYGFNKSHAAAYAYIAYQTAYLKTHYAEEFITANLNSNIGTLDTDKISMIIEDARKNNISIKGPDVNASFTNFTIEDERVLRYGLCALKGVGEKAALAIVEERKKGPYVDFYDFLERVGRGHVNKRVMEALVKSGAFDGLEPNRAALFEGIAEGLDYVSKYRKKQLADTPVIASLFDDDDAPVKPKKAKKVVELVKPELKEVEAWEELTTMKNEKSALGFYFSSNPYNTYYAKKLDGFEVASKIASIPDLYMEGETYAYVGGLIEEIKWSKKKTGAFVTVSDGTSSTDVWMYAEFLNDNKDWFREDAFVSLRLKLEWDDEKETVKTRAYGTFSFDQTQKLLTHKIFVGTENSDEQVRKFETICEPFISHDQREAMIVLCLEDETTGRRNKKAKTLYVTPEPKLIEQLVENFGETWVKPMFKKDIDNIVFPEVASKKGKKNYGNKSSAPKRNAFST